MSTMTYESELITVKEAAPLFHCSTQTLYRWIERGMIPESAVVRFGRTIRLRRKPLLQIAEEGVNDVRR